MGMANDWDWVPPNMREAHELILASPETGDRGSALEGPTTCSPRPDVWKAEPPGIRSQRLTLCVVINRAILTSGALGARHPTVLTHHVSFDDRTDPVIPASQEGFKWQEKAADEAHDLLSNMPIQTRWGWCVFQVVPLAGAYSRILKLFLQGVQRDMCLIHPQL